MEFKWSGDGSLGTCKGGCTRRQKSPAKVIFTELYQPNMFHVGSQRKNVVTIAQHVASMQDMPERASSNSAGLHNHNCARRARFAAHASCFRKQRVCVASGTDETAQEAVKSPPQCHQHCDWTCDHPLMFVSGEEF